MSTAIMPANGRAVATAQAPEQSTEAALLDRVVEATATHRYSLQEVQYMARAASQSKMFGMSESQAFVLMMLCEADGLHPMEAVRRYDINEYGAVSPKSVFVHAEMLRLGWKVQLLTDPQDDKKATFTFCHTSKPVVAASVTWGEEDARRAGLIDKKNYKAWTPDMYRSKAILRGARLNEPGIFVGVQDAEEALDDADAPRPERPIRRMDDPSTYVQAADEPAPAPEPEQPATRGEFANWLQTQIDDAENEWKMTCALAKKEHKKLGVNSWQAINGIVTDWIERDLIDPAGIATDGKRDRAKVLDLIRNQWAADDDGEGLMQDVRLYLRSKLDEAARDVGLNPDSEPAEEPANA